MPIEVVMGLGLFLIRSHDPLMTLGLAVQAGRSLAFRV